MDRKQELSTVEIEELRNRWKGPIGERIRRALLEGLKKNSYEWVEMLSQLPKVKVAAPHPEVLDDLRGIAFTGENLDNVSLTFVDLSYSIFEKCSMNSARLQGSKLSHVSFKSTKLIKADLVQVVADHSRFENCNLSGALLLAANFNDSSLNHMDMRKSILIDCSFNDCQLTKIILHGAKVEGAKFPAGFDIDKHLKPQPDNGSRNPSL
ncbi:pentapeptide repeat-containing protein [Pseudomonas sp.]|uniref:pentapeptide repeat-containing protein n=1 Tax=Pseudomonas sp. TaxID=306 RepID=UPI00248991EB|nr:pentapeptide repeat-containing protein [Pseudomonas sp.]MDI1330884.1 pentapeptide repeat-containing protein [Pseudomonas sp.]